MDCVQEVILLSVLFSPAHLMQGEKLSPGPGCLHLLSSSCLTPFYIVNKREQVVWRSSGNADCQHLTKLYVFLGVTPSLWPKKLLSQMP